MTKNRVPDPKTFFHAFKLNHQQETLFQTMMMEAGQRSMSRFIIGRIFGSTFKVVKTDKDAHDCYVRLTNLYGQIRAVGVNYNQAVKAIHTNFNDRRAAALLAQLEKYTKELTGMYQQVIALTEEFNKKWSVE